MKGDCEDFVAREGTRRPRTGNTPQGKINALLADLLEKEEELTVYKNRLQELEAAFYYNLKVISERDFELSVLEKQVAAGNKELDKVIGERNELEELIKAIDGKSRRKIEQLERRLRAKEDEMRDLRRENLNNISTLKKIIDDVKVQQEKKLSKMSAKFESQRNELMRDYRDQIEEKERYYLLEIDNLAGKLEQACREKDRLAYAEEEVMELKSQLKEVEELFLEKENHYLEEIRKISSSRERKVNKEVQCAKDEQQREKTVQAEPDVVVADSQTSPREDQYRERITFLQEQNEVLKFIIKDLKRNREGGGQPPGCECLTLRADVEVIKKRMESEMSNLKEILEREVRGRAEEEAVIGSLETSVRCLKEKLLSGLEERVQQETGEDIRICPCNNEIQVAFIGQKLCQKMDSPMTAAESEGQKVHQKVEELKQETVDPTDRDLESREDLAATGNDDLLRKIRQEMQELKSKIEGNVRNLLDNNNCHKNTGAPPTGGSAIGGYRRNDLTPEAETQPPKKALEEGMGLNPNSMRNNPVVGR